MILRAGLFYDDVIHVQVGCSEDGASGRDWIDELQNEIEQQ